jgi:hypothetical protein
MKGLTKEGYIHWSKTALLSAILLQPSNYIDSNFIPRVSLMYLTTKNTLINAERV